MILKEFSVLFESRELTWSHANLVLTTWKNEIIVVVCFENDLEHARNETRFCSLEHGKTHKILWSMISVQFDSATSANLCENKKFRWRKWSFFLQKFHERTLCRDAIKSLVRPFVAASQMSRKWKIDGIFPAPRFDHVVWRMRFWFMKICHVQMEISLSETFSCTRSQNLSRVIHENFHTKFILPIQTLPDEILKMFPTFSHSSSELSIFYLLISTSTLCQSLKLETRKVDWNWTGGLRATLRTERGEEIFNWKNYGEWISHPSTGNNNENKWNGNMRKSLLDRSGVARLVGWNWNKL